MQRARPMQTTVRAEIHLGALRHNLALARELAGPARVLAMIKADAYGHGLVPVARALAPGADGFGVARFHEALALREAGVTRRILLLGSLLDRELLQDRKSTRLNSSHVAISYAVFCLKKKKVQFHDHTL